MVLGVFFLILWRLRYQLLARVLHLPSPTNQVSVDPGIAIPASDGISLYADHYSPRKPGQYPIILIRSPYGREPSASAFGWLLAFIARRFAERGYHVLVQDVRGRFSSGGSFEPYFNERADGQATLAWIKRQPWYDGKIAMWGSSYLGIVQWVLADDPEIAALAPSITGSDLRSILFPDGSLDLGLMMRWMTVLDVLHQYRDKRNILAAKMWYDIENAIEAAFSHLPVETDDEVALGKIVPFYHLWMEHHAPDDAIWQEARESLRVEDVQKPIHLVGGWYDFFLRAMLQDYQALEQKGHQPYLTIGPWHHFNAMVSFVDLREGMTWFEAHLKGKQDVLRQKPVRLFVMGSNEWRDMDTWPPSAQHQSYYLQPDFSLDTSAPEIPTHSVSYVYDPAEPTPSIGGTVFGPWQGGRHDNRPLECRDDVLTFTSEPLPYDLDVIGYVRLQLHVLSSCESADFFGRLCDLTPDGKSYNVCDGLLRVSFKDDGVPAGQPHCIEIDMWATAHCFKQGHSIRLQVSSGAHPRWARNLGTGDDLVAGTALQAAEQTVFIGNDHPSQLILPIT